MTKEQVLEDLGKGWFNIIEDVYSIQQQLPFCSGVESIKRKNGMLSVVFSYQESTTDVQKFILRSVEYKIERITAILCEECGTRGKRRLDLPEIKTLCISCYAHKYSELNSVPSLVASSEPQID